MQFPALFGDTYKTVKATYPHLGSGGYDILIDNYLQGTMFYREGAWLVYLNRNSQLQGDDIAVLIEVIEAAGV